MAECFATVQGRGLLRRLYILGRENMLYFDSCDWIVTRE